MDEDGIHDLIGIIYDAALDPSCWARAILELKTATQSRHGHLWAGNVRDTVQTFVSEREAYLAFDNREFSFSDFQKLGDLLHNSTITDPHLPCADQAPQGQAVLGCELVPLRELHNSSFYNEFNKHFGNFQMLASVMMRDEGAIDAITFYRSEEDDYYSNEEKRLLDIFLPHIRRSLRLFGQLQLANTQTAVLRNSIDALSSAVVLLNQTGKVIFLNAAAEHFLKRCPDLSLKRDNLRAKSHADTVQLERLVKTVTGSNGQRPIGGAVAIRRAQDGGLPLQVVAAPVPVDNRGILNGASGAVALLVIHDPNAQPRLPQETIGAVFGVTPVEASLMLAIANGQTLQEYSDAHRVTQNTVRTHLKSVFAKTGASKQSDLVRLMSGLVHSVSVPAR